MGTKLKPGKFDCYSHAASDEPMFILLARDISAPIIVLLWCLQRTKMIVTGEKPLEDVERLEEALQCAKDMIIYKGEQDATTTHLIEQVEKSIQFLNITKVKGTLTEVALAKAAKTEISSVHTTGDRGYAFPPEENISAFDIDPDR